MKQDLRLTAFLQASGVAIYVLLLAYSGQNFISQLHPAIASPILALAFFLLLFVTSALICGGLVLGYPAYLFFNGERKTAIRLVLWSVGWLVILLLVLVFILLRLNAG